MGWLPAVMAKMLCVFVAGIFAYRTFDFDLKNGNHHDLGAMGWMFFFLTLAILFRILQEVA